MDDHKVKAILDWELLRSVLTLRSFLRLASYYRKFIKNFVKIATPLTNLLKKSSRTYEWEEACNEAFETLKGILVKTPVLKFPNFDKDFEIHSDASDFAIGGVLVQDGRPVAFESKKLSETERKWLTHGEENMVPDALSRKHQLKVVYVGETKFQKEVRLGSHHDEFAKEKKQDIQKGIKFHFHLWNGLLWYKQNRLYVPKGRLRDVLLKKCHDGPLASHGGAKRTTTFLKKSYYWPNLKEDMEEYVKTCLTCQQNRVLNKKQVGLLWPLPILEGPWESVSMDFMVSLPPSRGFDAIMVVVDWFNKMAHFIPTKESATAQETGRLFFTHVFKHHSLPKNIVSHQDPKFTSKFWKALWKRMGWSLRWTPHFDPKRLNKPRGWTLWSNNS